MKLQDLNNDNQHLLLKCISGSQAYGLALPHSDTDVKGVFVLPKNEFYGLQYIDQINNETNDEMFYEVRKFFDLLLKNNPNLLELLNTPDDCVLYKHPIMSGVKSEVFLSRLCAQTFGQYAYAQIEEEVAGFSLYFFGVVQGRDRLAGQVEDDAGCHHISGERTATDFIHAAEDREFGKQALVMGP
jgi:hypothetical protein